MRLFIESNIDSHLFDDFVERLGIILTGNVYIPNPNVSKLSCSSYQSYKLEQNSIIEFPERYTTNKVVINGQLFKYNSEDKCFWSEDNE